MLFLVSAESGVATSDIFPIESIVAASSMVCTTIAYDLGIATSWVVCTTVVAESRVATGGIFPVEHGVAASSIVYVAHVQRRNDIPLHQCIGKILGGNEFLSFISGRREWKSPPSILVNKNPNWS
ncbi:hypothetical protein NC651_017998 [Populus alba x Populus x berolinensis]|nr:hypothetical protein NC651_017998 [Populus alba x Populus x berolinensis]